MQFAIPLLPSQAAILQLPSFVACLSELFVLFAQSTCPQICSFDFACLLRSPTVHKTLLPTSPSIFAPSPTQSPFFQLHLETTLVLGAVRLDA